MNKHDAAKLLGVSERTIAAYAASGRLSVRYVKGKTRDIADYDEEELARLKEAPYSQTVNREGSNPEERESETALAVERPVNPETVKNGVSMFLLTDRQFAALSKSAEVALTDKPVLTFSEAAKVTGFAEGLLREAAKAGSLKSRKIGRASRVRRSDLDAWIDGQFA